MSRRWRLPDGRTLVQGEARSTRWGDHGGVPLLEDAHDYVLLDAEGRQLWRFEGRTEDEGHYRVEEMITRFAVQDGALVRVVFFCHEESTFDLPIVSQMERETVLDALTEIP